MKSNEPSKLNFLSTTDRRFYKRKKPSQQKDILNTSDSKIFTAIKGLNNTSFSLRKLNCFKIVKTEQSQPRYSQALTKTTQRNFFKMSQNRRQTQIKEQHFQQPQFIKKEIRSKLLLLLRKSTLCNSKKWKMLYDSYQGLKSCQSQNSFNSQENKFLTIMTDLLKGSIEDGERLQNMEKLVKKQSTISESKKDEKVSKINLQRIKLMRENQLLRKRCCEPLIKLNQSNNNNKVQTQHNQHLSQQQQLSNNRPVQAQQHNNNNKPIDSMATAFWSNQQIIKQKQKILQLQQTISELQKQNETLKQNLISAQVQLKIIRDDRQLVMKKFMELKAQNQNLCADIVRISLEKEEIISRINKWRAIMGFQRQQIFSYQRQLHSYKRQYHQLMRKYKNTVKTQPNTNNQKHFTTTNNNYNITNKTSHQLPSRAVFSNQRQTQQLKQQYNQTFKQQLQSFNKIRPLFYQKQSQHHLQKTHNVLVGQNMNDMNKRTLKSQKQVYTNYLTQKETICNKNGIKKIDRKYYGYFKPSFFAFVENYMDMNGIDLINMEQISGESYELDCDFLVTLRAIMDSKFNDFLEQNFSKASSFPNFTYVWLSKYKVNRRQKKIVCIQRDLDQIVIPKFFMNLMGEKLNSNWEIITFREFLMESLTLDELYFYLMARHFLFQGSLLDNLKAVYQQICLVSITQALNTIQRFIQDVNYRKRIEEYLRGFIVYVKNKPFIDAHFILRILLEYYQAKKHQEFANLHSLSDFMSKDKPDEQISFDSFLKIFDYNFLYLSLSDKVQIYKKSFSCSRGKITLQTILTVMTEQGYLCREVKKIFCNQNLILKKQQVKEQAQIIGLQDNLPQLTYFQKAFDKIYNQYFYPRRAQLGLFEIQRKFQLLKQFDQTKMFQQMEIVFRYCNLTIKEMFYSKKISVAGFLPILKELSDILLRVNKVTCEKQQILTIMGQFKRQAAARRIIRFYRKKRNQMHRNYVLGAKDDSNQQQQKITNLRKEFNFLISNLKDKASQIKQTQSQLLNYQEL